MPISQWQNAVTLQNIGGGGQDIPILKCFAHMNNVSTDSVTHEHEELL